MTEVRISKSAAKKHTQGKNHEAKLAALGCKSFPRAPGIMIPGIGAVS